MALAFADSAAASGAPGEVLRDARVAAVITRMLASRGRPTGGGPRTGGERDPHAYAGYGFSIYPDQGDLLYLLCRALGARRVVDFATSVGFSTLYLAAAMRDNGGGRVIGAEIVPEKIAAAQRNLEAAGLAAFVEIRAGDARQTLRDVGGDIDLALIDGWPGDSGPSLSLQVMRVLAPQMRLGAVAVNDNAEEDYLEFVRKPQGWFRSMTLPLKGGTEVSVKAA
jgi:predicted O-methyltransferase YrrM